MSDYETGLGILKARMQELGASSALQNSKAIPYVLQALCQDGNILDYFNTRELLREKARELYEREQEILHKNDELTKCRKQLSEFRNEYGDIENNKQVLDYIEETREYIDKYIDMIENGNENAKKVISLAQFFINNVKVETKYDNTAYIVGLSAILTGGEIDSVEQMQKINPSMFKDTAEQLHKGWIRRERRR